MDNRKRQPCIFYIVRHGETELNRKGILQGQKDSVLTPEAIIETKKLARELKKISFAAAFSSDLLRAKKTTEIIALEHQLTVQTNKLLRERTFGKADGTSLKKLVSLFREIAEKKEKLGKEEAFRFKPFPGMESDREVIIRITTFLRETASVYGGKNVLVGAHSGIILYLLMHVGFISYRERNDWAIPNLSYLVFQSDGVKSFIKGMKGIKKKEKTRKSAF